VVVVGLKSMVSLHFLGDLEHVGASLGLDRNGGIIDRVCFTGVRSLGVSFCIVSTE
jgi:hypothetical protein